VKTIKPLRSRPLGKLKLRTLPKGTTSRIAGPGATRRKKKGLKGPLQGGEDLTFSGSWRGSKTQFSCEKGGGIAGRNSTNGEGASRC